MKSDLLFALRKAVIRCSLPNAVAYGCDCVTGEVMPRKLLSALEELRNSTHLREVEFYEIVDQAFPEIAKKLEMPLENSHQEVNDPFALNP